MEMSFFKRSRVVVYRPGLFEGRERLDLIKRLNDMQTYHILAMVWKHLSAEDLGRVLQVSTSWNTAILMDKYSMEKYVAAKERISENTLAHKQIQERMRLSKTSPRKALTSVSNLLLTPVKTENRRSPRLANSPTSSGGSQKRGIDELSKPMIVSPSKFRHRLFTEEAQRLGPDEKLQPCPRCTCPSRVIPSEDRACCSRISCQFNFCTLCMCTYHHDSPCRITRGCKMKGTTSPTSSPSNASSGCSSTKARVSSKQSKSRLKRL
jgi:F-box protein 5